jgi:hypothetical protein
MFNIKRLAFETRPINPMEGDTPSSAAITGGRGLQAAPAAPAPPTSSPVAPVKSWMDEIDERIRLKAMNAPISLKSKPSSLAPSGPAPLGPSPMGPAPSGKEKVEGPLGSGISEDEVERIMKEFSKR